MGRNFRKVAVLKGGISSEREVSLRSGAAIAQGLREGGYEVEEIDIDDVDIDDPAFESLLVGRKVRVLLQDVDLVRWKQDLLERTCIAIAVANFRLLDAHTRAP